MTTRKTEDDRSASERYDYVVGYGKPPKATQFQPGCSGKKRRRPKRSPTLGMAIRAGLHGTVTVRKGTVDGEPIKMTALECAAANLVQRAMKGDIAAIKEVMKLDREAARAEAEASRELDGPYEPSFNWTEEQAQELRSLLREPVDEGLHTNSPGANGSNAASIPGEPGQSP